MGAGSLQMADATLTTFSHLSPHYFGRDSVGGSTVVGDKRWTGTFGVNVDLVAKSHCSVELIMTEDILVNGILCNNIPSIQSQQEETD